MIETPSFPKNQPKYSPDFIQALNKKYKPLSYNERIKEIYKDFNSNEIMLTSSFAATSALLLKLVSDVNNKQKIYFIDTSYHFKDTLKYKDELTKRFNLNVSSISGLDEQQKFTTKDKTWEKNPDLCCSINKIQPLNIIKQYFNVWISGLMEWQSDHRSTLDIFELRGDILKFYPLLDMTKEERDDLIQEFDLPFHPLVAKGYHSIGCKHCTVPGNDRDGRWNNNPKTECGLHL